MLLLGRHRFAKGKEADVTKSVCGGTHITPWLHLPVRLEFSTLSSTQWLPSFHPKNAQNPLLVVSNVPGPLWKVHNTLRGGSSWFQHAAVGGGGAHVSYRCNTSGPAGLGRSLQSLRRSVSETVIEQCFPSIA